MESVCVNDPTICAIQRWRVGCDAQVTSSSVLCLVTRSDGSTARVIAPVSGRVVRIAKQNGDLVNMGDTLVELATSCRHDVVMKDICALCGANLREQLGCPGQRVVASSAKVAMVHSIPELHVSEERALRLAVADESRLLRHRRLSLLVDLDQTLIHTTMGSIPDNLADVTRFKLPDSSNFNCNSVYATKVRPGVKQFLNAMSKIFEMHIVTFGNRLYAHRIAEILDPDKCYFSHRILSRDEAFNPTTKTGNLQALFPRGDKMVCIIDDREEVWDCAPNLVHVKQYSYFAGTEDINNPHRIQPDSTETFVDPMDEVAVAAKQRAAILEAAERCNVEKTITECTVSEDVAKSVEDDVVSENVMKEEIPSPKSPGQELLNWPDHDTYLVRLQTILTDIHREFFARLNVTSESSSSTSDQHELPSLRDVVPLLRRQVLKGCVIVFSGVFPMHMPLERSKAYQIATSLGAVVQSNLVLTEASKKNCQRRKKKAQNETNSKRKKRMKFEDKNCDDAKDATTSTSSYSFSSDNEEKEKSVALSEESAAEELVLTTHLVSARTNTSKWHAARRADLAVVSPDWLWACHYHWQRMSESDYELSEDTGVAGTAAPVAQTKQQSEEMRKIKLREERQFAKMRHEAKRAAREEERQLAAALPPPARFDLADHPLLRMSRDDLEDMEDEVNAAQGSDSDSSSESSSSRDDKHERELRLAVLSNSPSLSAVDPDDVLGGEQIGVESAVNDESYPLGWAPRRRQRDDDANDALLKDSERDWGDGFAHEGYDYDDAERRFRALSESSSSTTSDSSDRAKVDDVGDDTLDALRDFM